MHEGSPPQTNLVRVNGSRAVLMTVLKAGTASTLDIIDGIKSLLPRVEEAPPASLNLHAVGDQSVFVKAAVFGVIREAVLAAALVGLMILLFLGSWRSTRHHPHVESRSQSCFRSRCCRGSARPSTS